jgi:hypothetical protein
MVQKSAHQHNQKRYTQYNIHQGASNAPPAAPPSGGGGGGAPAGPSCPGGRRPLVIAAAIAACRTRPHHGTGNPIHYSKNPSSWMRVCMPSGMSCSTALKRRCKSSISPPATVGGA